MIAMEETKVTTERDEKLKEIIEAINMLQEDSTVPRNIKEKMKLIISILNNGSDTSMKIDKALQELDEIADDTNLQAFTRTQIWNIVSMLEKI